MNYTLHQLQIFLQVVRQKSITKAAEELHMTQPAVSIQLKNFQNQFDIPLTEVIGKKLYVTDFGRSVAEIAENVLREADALINKTKDYHGLLTGNLRISSASTGKYVIPYFLSKFLHRHSSIELKLDVSNKTTVLKNLENNEIDFALVSVLPSTLNVEQEILLQNKLFLVNSTKKLQPNRPLIYREAGSATRSAMDQYFQDHTTRKSIELTSNEAVKQAVIAGLGYSIIPLIGIKNELSNKQLFIIPSKGLPIVTHWRLIWLKNKKLSPVAIAYLEYIRAEKDMITEKQFAWYSNFTPK